MRLQKSNDPDTFYSSFTSLISSNAETFFTTQDYFTATLIPMNLARKIYQEFLKQKEQSTTHNQKTVPLTKNELDRFQYLRGYIVKNFIKNLKNNTNYKTEKYQIMIAILEGIYTNNHDQKLINCLSRGGLTAVHSECLPIFLSAEELFWKKTMGNLHKIDVAEMVDQRTTKPDVISIFNNILEESGVKIFLPELKINLLTLILSLYLKVRGLSKADDITNKAKELETQRSKGLRKTIKQKSSK